VDNCLDSLVFSCFDRIGAVEVEDYFVAISIVVVCSALLAWLASLGRQPVILAYFVCGVLLGPAMLGLFDNVHPLENISRIGVTLLLFLAGLVLHPDRLRKFLRSALTITLGGSIITYLLVYAFLRTYGYSSSDSNIGSLALMFSSTILVVKLLPTRTLHQQHMGSICIAVLIAQDFLAVLLLIFLGTKSANSAWYYTLMLPLKTVLFITAAVLIEQYGLRWMMRRSDRYREVLLMLCLGWCLGLAVLAEHIGLSYEVGAFIAGVSMARGKIALVFSERLKPLRDFFLMFFFFVLGARFELLPSSSIWVPAILVAGLIVLARPLYLRLLLRCVGESPNFSKETALRLGQASEFALIIAAAAVSSGRLSEEVSQVVQIATMLTMVISSYLVVMKFPTPLGVSPALKKD